MKHKRFLIDIIVILLAFVVFAVWYNHRDGKVHIASVAVPNIHLVTMDKVSEYWYTMDKGAAIMADMLGVTYTWDAPLERDVEQQIVLFNRAVNTGADAIMLAASDPVRISGAVEDAKARGVKIIYVDAPSVEESIVTLATENYSAGKIAGESMIMELEAAGKTAGSIGIIGVTPENVTTMNREKGFREVLEQDGRFVLLNTKYTEGDIEASRKASLEFMNGTMDLVGLFGTNEGSTIGVGKALQTGNAQITAIGFDFTEEIANMLRSNVLQAVMVQNPFTMGYLGVAEAVAAVKGYETGPSFIDTGVTVITRHQLK